MTDTTPLIASAAPAAGGHEGHKNALGTFNGCYIPCCLNILGIILFLKLGWAVGQAGILGVLGIFAIAATASLLLGMLLTRFIEQPAQRWLRRRVLGTR